MRMRKKNLSKLLKYSLKALSKKNEEHNNKAAHFYVDKNLTLTLYYIF